MEKVQNTSLDSISEQTARMKLALHHVNGDVEKAREMLSGSYKDLYVLKGLFQSSSLNGVFIVFYNNVYNRLYDSCVAVLPTYMTRRMNTSVDWKVFEKELVELRGNKDYNESLSTTLKNRLSETFNMGFCKDLNRYIEHNNAISLQRSFQKLIQFIFNLQRIDLKVEYQSLSSLDAELYSVTTHKTDPSTLNVPEQGADESAKAGKSENEEDIHEGQEGVKMVLSAGFVLAPIRGRDISSLQPGDRVKVVIHDKNPKAVAVAQALNSYESDAFKPMTARIKTITYNRDSGYTIFAIIAKGVFVKIIEAESNIKVLMDAMYEMARVSPEEGTGRTISIIIAVTVIFLVIGIIVAVLIL